MVNIWNAQEKWTILEYYGFHTGLLVLLRNVPYQILLEETASLSQE